MSFDANKFKATNFNDRKKSLPVPQLKAFFPEDVEPTWTVRGLTGVESARSRQAVTDSKNLEAVIEALGSGSLKLKTEAIRKVAGLDNLDDVPEDIVRRYSWLTQASVDPACDYPMAIKLAENFPEIFYALTNTILSLTHLGRLGE